MLSLRGLFLAGAILGSLGGGACTPQRTEIVLVVDSDMVPPDDFDQVRIHIDTATDTGRFDRTVDVGPERTPMPLVLGLVPDSDESLAFRATATALKGGAFVAERIATTSFVPGRTLVLSLPVWAVCRGIKCDRGQSCSINGVCVPEAVDSHMLPPYQAATAADAAVSDLNQAVSQFGVDPGVHPSGPY